MPRIEALTPLDERRSIFHQEAKVLDGSRSVAFALGAALGASRRHSEGTGYANTMSGFLRGIAAPVAVGLVNRRQQMQSTARVTGNLIVARYAAASKATPQTAATMQAQADAKQQWQTFNAMASHLNRQLDELMTEQTEGLDAYFEGDLAVDIAKGQLKELTKFGGKAAIDLARAAANDVRLRMMHHPSTSEDQRAAALIQYLLGKVALEAPRAGGADD